jgi:pimeloyl-ACP methyl ester carboxylesterase
MLLHGYRGHARWWSAIAPYFVDRYRVYALDLSGMGDSGTRPYYDAAVFARDLTGTLEQAGLAPATLVAHSFGGSCAIRALADTPGLIDHAIIVDSYCGFRDGEVPVEIPRAGSGRTFSDYRTLYERYRLLPPQPVAFAEIFDYVAHHSMRQVADGWCWKCDIGLPNTTLEFNGRELLSRVDIPVDILVGELSPLLSVAHAQRIVDLLPQARGPIVVPQAHHHIMLDQPLVLIGMLQALLA